jgi:hypothetical protein
VSVALCRILLLNANSSLQLDIGKVVEHALAEARLLKSLGTAAVLGLVLHATYTQRYICSLFATEDSTFVFYPSS